MSIFIELPLVITHTKRTGISSQTDTRPRMAVINVEEIQVFTPSLDVEASTLIIWKSGGDATAAIPYESMCDMTRPIKYSDEA